MKRNWIYSYRGLRYKNVNYYLGDFWLSQCATNKLDYFSMLRVISRRVLLSLIAYSSTSQKKWLPIPCIINWYFYPFKGNIIWTCSGGPVTSLDLALLSFAKKSSHRFLSNFSVLSYCRYCSHWIYKVKSGGHRARLREKELLSRYRGFLSQQLDAIFVALKLQLKNRTCKPGAIFSATCRRDIAGLSNMFETWCNFSATKIASSCRDKNRLCKRAFMFCTRARSCACADDAKIVRSRNAQCKSRESP